MAKLPTVVTNIAPDLRAFINRVREAIEGTGGEKLVTVNDLVGAGIAATGPGGAITQPGISVVGTPPAPTNVAATGAIQNIVVTWDNPTYSGHAYAEVWGSSTNNIGQAVRLGMAPGGIFVDATGPSTERYYWVRFVNILDTAGPYNALSGVRGQTGSDVAYMLDTLTTAALDPAAPYSKYAVRADFFYVVPKVEFNQETTPVASSVGNLWYQPSSGRTRTWTGSTWGPFSQTLPFVINTIPQTINGVEVPAGVYMDAAFIKDGTITNAKIGNAAIDDAKIASLSVSKLVAGSIAAGEYIQSSNYVPNTQGFRLDANGTAEFQNAVVRGTVFASSGQFYGTLLGGYATSYTDGIGFYSGIPTTTYQWRVGNPTGNKIAWDGTNLEVVSPLFNLSSGSATFGGSLTARTILADNIVANAIAVANQYYISGSITAIATFGTTLTTSNTNIIGQFTVSNTSNVNATLSAVGTGRSGASGASNNQYQAFSVFDDGGLTLFNYGWTEMLEDAKAFSFTFQINANSSKTFYIRGAKTDTPTLGYSLQIIVVGVKN